MARAATTSHPTSRTEDVLNGHSLRNKMLLLSGDHSCFYACLASNRPTNIPTSLSLG